jgi:hypothetical protein
LTARIPRPHERVVAEVPIDRQDRLHRLAVNTVLPPPVTLKQVDFDLPESRPPEMTPDQLELLIRLLVRDESAVQASRCPMWA